MNKTLLVIFALVAVVSAVRFPIESQPAIEKAEPFLKKTVESIQKNKNVAEIVEKWASNLVALRNPKSFNPKLEDTKNYVNEVPQKNIHLNDDSVLAGETKNLFKKPSFEKENAEEKQKDDSEDELKIQFGLTGEDKKSLKNMEEEEDLDENVEKKENKIDLLNEKDLAEEEEESDAMISYGLFDKAKKNAEKVEDSENLSEEEEDEGEEEISQDDIIKYVDEIQKLVEHLEKADEEEKKDEEEEEDLSDSNDDVIISYGLAGDLSNKGQYESKVLTEEEAGEKMTVDALLFAIKKFAADNGFKLHKQVRIEDNEKLRFDTSNDEDDDELAGKSYDWKVENFAINNKNGPSDDEDMNAVHSGDSKQ